MNTVSPKTIAMRRFRIGDIIQTGDSTGLGGEVVALRDVSETRQVLTVRTSEGTIVPVTVDVADGGTIVLPPSSMEEAVNLAHRIVSGHEPHMAVAVQIAILANAVISLSAGVVPLVPK